MGQLACSPARREILEPRAIIMALCNLTKLPCHEKRAVDVETNVDMSCRPSVFVDTRKVHYENMVGSKIGMSAGITAVEARSGCGERGA